MTQTWRKRSFSPLFLADIDKHLTFLPASSFLEFSVFNFHDTIDDRVIDHAIEGTVLIGLLFLSSKDKLNAALFDQKLFGVLVVIYGALQTLLGLEITFLQFCFVFMIFCQQRVTSFLWKNALFRVIIIGRLKVHFPDLYRLIWFVCFFALFLFVSLLDPYSIELRHEYCISHCYIIHDKRLNITKERADVY